jgi:predicted AAA+ superfamily ATPase
MAFRRLLDIKGLVASKSHFLFGPRLTGKTTLIRETFQDVPIINLLDSSTRLRLLQRPSDLESLIIPSNSDCVIIDEIQKVPDLLDEVHKLIEEKHLKFLLTGSSARKLKRTHANLLGGRARVAKLFPLTTLEIPDFDLTRYLAVGGLPPIYLSQDPFEDLIAYVDTYLNEEVEQEARVRNLGNFSRFLKSAALSNSQIVNFAAIASDSMVKESTVKGYYQVLMDTLLGETLEPWTQSKKRKAIQTPKFFFFDVGVANAILGRTTLSKEGVDFGHAFEHFIYMELKAAISYFRKHESLCFWRSVNQQEVDFVIGNRVAIEVKSKERATFRECSGLLALQEENTFKTYFLVSRDPTRRKENGITFVHYRDFLRQLWGGEIL